MILVSLLCRSPTNKVILAFLCNNCHGLMDSGCNFADVDFSVVDFRHGWPIKSRKIENIRSNKDQDKGPSINDVLIF